MSLVPGAAENHPSTGYRIVDRHDYEKVLDLVFMGYMPEDKNADQFILRFEPSRQPESFLTITWKQDNVSVMQCVAANGQVWAMLNGTLNHTGTIDKEAAAKSVQVKCGELRVSHNQGDLWRSRFFAALTESGSVMALRNAEHQSTGKVIVTLDGTTYRIAYWGYPADISLTFQDFEVGGPSAHSPVKLVRWAGAIEREIHHQMKDARGSR